MAIDTTWCHDGTMKRMNLRDVPEDVYEVLTRRAQLRRQSLNAYVVERLSDEARRPSMADYVLAYDPPVTSGGVPTDAVEALREARDEREAYWDRFVQDGIRLEAVEGGASEEPQ